MHQMNNILHTGRNAVEMESNLYFVNICRSKAIVLLVNS